MKKSILLFVFILPLISTASAKAFNWKVIGACSPKATHQGSVDADLATSIGKLSEEIFIQNKIPYTGSAAGFNSIANSPIGLDAIEVVSDSVMRVYGWCYAVNGKVVNELADQAFLKNTSDTLVWFYAYSTNVENKWTDYCIPAYEVEAEQFCN